MEMGKPPEMGKERKKNPVVKLNCSARSSPAVLTKEFVIGLSSSKKQDSRCGSPEPQDSKGREKERKNNYYLTIWGSAEPRDK